MACGSLIYCWHFGCISQRNVLPILALFYQKRAGLTPVVVVLTDLYHHWPGQRFMITGTIYPGWYQKGNLLKRIARLQGYVWLSSQSINLGVAARYWQQRLAALADPPQN
jgi:hypothetical protein